ncbi:putative penicillin-binding protein [Bisporella sp. PMI_857]|nr:putative penicillin-binding protein [Bisporella sp. PMI_857]
MLTSNMFRNLVRLGLLSLVVGSALAEQVVFGGPVNPLDDEFAKFVDEALEDWHVPGVAVGVIDGDEVFTQGYGIARFPDTPVTPSTLFWGGSTTKAFTASALSFLVDDNERYPEVQWKTPVSDLIREDFVLTDPWATTHITIEDILSHRTGLPRHDLSYGGSQDTLKTLVQSLRHLPLTAEPRTKFQYCNIMFMVASYLVETLEGKWLGDVLKERIWGPLGMSSTFLAEKDAEASKLPIAAGYAWNNSSFQAIPTINLTLVSGAGAIISNVLDYSKWIKSMIDSSPPLSASAHKALRTGRTLRGESPWSTGEQSYALGWIKGVCRGHEFIAHDGSTDAFGTAVMIFPALKYGIVAFANTAGTGNALNEILAWKLIHDKLKVPERSRYDFGKSQRDGFKLAEDRYNNAINISFPSLPDPPLPLPVPLLNYTGTYFHPAFRNVTLVLKDDALFINRTDAAWRVTIQLEHVSGNYFMAYVSRGIDLPIYKQALPAEFEVGSDGVVRKLGVAEESAMRGEKIWFNRVA